MTDDCLDGLLSNAALVIQVLRQASEMEGLENEDIQQLKMLGRGAVLLTGFLVMEADGKEGVYDLYECERAGIDALRARMESES